MKILLDTHVLIWLHTDIYKLSDFAKNLILNPANEIYYSSINIWETQIKFLNHPEEFTISGEELNLLSIKANLNCLNLEPKHIFALNSLHYDESALKPHKDPFDKILLCQAKIENMKFLTHDSLIPNYNESCIIHI